jgi:hypothetical protein
MNEENIKQAFSKVKEDIDLISAEISLLKRQLSEINQLLNASTIRQSNTTNLATSTDNTTIRQEIEGLKTQNLDISTGNQGASTDRQTDTSTDTSTHFYPKNTKNSPQNIDSDIYKASEILDSLDRLKKEIRLKFKRVTAQEMLVFSTIYQLEEVSPNLCNYPQIAKKIGLSESSIRDYVQRMINKGIPIRKNKINNKKILLSISSELKKIATLSTIIKLREL